MKMKKLIYLLLLPVAMVAIVACSGRSGNTKDDTQVLMQDSTDANGLQRMPTSQREADIQYKGKDYHYSIVRTPNDSLAHVMSEMGSTYVDNQIAFRLTRGGESICGKTFTKNSFSSVIEADFLSKSVLESLAYNKTTPEGMVFVASISYPQTDLYFPVSVTISSDGKMTMKREEPMENLYQESDVR